MESILKRIEVELEILPGKDMLITIEKDIRGGICH